MSKKYDFSKFAKDEKSFKTGDVIEFRRGRFAGKIADIMAAIARLHARRKVKQQLNIGKILHFVSG